MNQYITESTTGENYIKDGFRRDDPRIEKILKEKRDAAKERRKTRLILQGNVPSTDVMYYIVSRM